MEQGDQSQRIEEWERPERRNEWVGPSNCFCWEISSIVVSRRLEIRCIVPPPLGCVAWPNPISRTCWLILPISSANRSARSMRWLSIWISSPSRKMPGCTSNCAECMQKSPAPTKFFAMACAHFAPTFQTRAAPCARTFRQPRRRRLPCAFDHRLICEHRVTARHAASGSSRMGPIEPDSMPLLPGRRRRARKGRPGSCEKIDRKYGTHLPRDQKCIPHPRELLSGHLIAKDFRSPAVRW
jgi:hypothetical protein